MTATFYRFTKYYSTPFILYWFCISDYCRISQKGDSLTNIINNQRRQICFPFWSKLIKIFLTIFFIIILNNLIVIQPLPYLSSQSGKKDYSKESDVFKTKNCSPSTITNPEGDKKENPSHRWPAPGQIQVKAILKYVQIQMLLIIFGNPK